MIVKICSDLADVSNFLVGPFNFLTGVKAVVLGGSKLGRMASTPTRILGYHAKQADCRLFVLPGRDREIGP